MKKDIMEKLKFEVNSLQKQLRLSKSANQELQQLVAQLNSKLLEEKISKNKVKDKLQQCERCYKICKADVQFHLDEVRILKEEILEKNEKIENIEQENADLKIQLAKKEKDLDEMKKDFEMQTLLEKGELEFQNMKLQEVKTQQKQEITKLQSQLRDCGQNQLEEVQILKKEILEKNKKIGNFEGAVTSLKSQIRLEKEKKRKLEVENSRLLEIEKQQKNKTTTLESHLQSLETKQSDAIKEIEILKDEILDKNMKIEDFESQVGTLKAQLSKKNPSKDFESLKMRWEVQHRLELEQKTMSLERQNMELQSTIEQKMVEIQALRECLKDLKLRYDEIENMHKKRKLSEVYNDHSSTASQFNNLWPSNMGLVGAFSPFGNCPITMMTPTPAASASTMTAAATPNGGNRNIPPLMSLQITTPPPHPPPPVMSLEVTPPNH